MFLGLYCILKTLVLNLIAYTKNKKIPYKYFSCGNAISDEYGMWSILLSLMFL